MNHSSLVFRLRTFLVLYLLAIPLASGYTAAGVKPEDGLANGGLIAQCVAVFFLTLLFAGVELTSTGLSHPFDGTE